jgi:hypothetical protein
MDTQTVEIIGRNYLVSVLVSDGLEVARPERDRGVDLIAYLDIDQAHRFVACPIQMKAATTASFSLFSKYERIAQLLLVHVWYVTDPDQACAYALRYDEAKKVADEMGWTGTDSWLRGGYSTTRPSQRVRMLLEPYRMKPGDWRRKVREAGTARNLPVNGDERPTMRVSALFDPEPRTWGLRGDSCLWRALREHLEDRDVPATEGELTSLLREAFRELVGIDLASDPATSVYREQYAHGGMSNGMIDLETWRQRLMPMLAERAERGSHPDRRIPWPPLTDALCCSCS